MWDIIEECGNACKLSYNEPSAIDSRINCTFINDQKYDGQCYVIFQHDKIIIAFRGTTSISDWKTDFNITLINPEYFGLDKKIKVHKGFHNQYSQMKSQIHSTILNYRDYPIYITGHSLGGALAYLCALDLSMNDFCSNITVVTIGSPRPGNQHFVNRYNKLIKNSYRVKNYGDPITYFPMRYDYRHVHGSICIKEGEVFKEKIFKKFINRLWKFINHVQLSSSYRNHSLDLYLNNINVLFTKSSVLEIINRPRIFSV